LADQRITQLVELSKEGAVATDVLPISDVSASETKKITVKNLIAAGIDLVDTGEIDLAKLDQQSTTKLGTVALADSSITASKLADQSSAAVATLDPSTDNYTGRAVFNPVNGNLKFFNGSSYQQVVMPTAGIGDLQVTNDKLATGAVTTDKVSPLGTLAYADSSITTAKIQDLAITSAKIAANTITADNIAPNAVGQSELADASVDTNAIIDGSISAIKLSTDSVTTEKIVNLSITNAKIAENTIAYSKLAIADAAIPGAKIANDSITATQIAAGAIGTSELASGSVTAAKIGALAVETASIAALAVTEDKIGLSAVTTTKLANSSVTYSKIQNISNTDFILGRSSAGAGVIEEIPCTAAGRSLLAGATVSDQRQSLGLGDLSVANGTWIDGSSFSGVSSGVNTGDQTITLIGAVTGTGTGSFETTLAENIVLEANIATGAVTSAKIAVGAVTQERLSDNSAAVVSSGAPVGNGAFIGQHWINTSSAIDYVWTGTIWLQQASINTIAVEETTPITLNVSYPDPYTAILTAALDVQGAATVWAGPQSGDDATPAFRALVSSDLPIASASATGAVKPGTGLAIPEDGTGVLNHTNSVTAATVSGITFDAQGHISAAVPLAASDIPELDASKVGTGTFNVDRIAAKSITSAKLADYATAQLGETLPVPNFIGEIFLNPLDKTFFMWDGNVWVPIGISAGQVVFAGTYNANTNTVASVTSDGSAIGLSIGQPLPSAGSSNSSYYVVVSTGGTGVSPAPAVTLAPPDILLSNGTNWVEVDVSSTYVAQSAANVGFTPAANLGSTNVQAALEEVSNECRNAANITSGTLAVARGGTGLTTYAKGDLVVGTASNVLATLTVGTDGQFLSADSTQPNGVKWHTPAVYVSSVASTTAALTVTNPTTTPSLAIRTATTAVNGIVQLSDSVSTTSSTLAATSTAVKTAYDLANAALPKAGGVVTGDLQLAQNVGITYEGNTIDAFQTRIYVAEPTADHTILFPDMAGTLAMVSQLDDGTF
jgi:hypothetical protein